MQPRDECLPVEMIDNGNGHAEEQRIDAEVGGVQMRQMVVAAALPPSDEPQAQRDNGDARGESYSRPNERPSSFRDLGQRQKDEGQKQIKVLLDGQRPGVTP